VQLQPTATGEATTKQVPSGANYLHRSVSNELILHLLAGGERGKTHSLITLFIYRHHQTAGSLLQAFTLT
jgi:hypothetical protein